MQKQVIANNLNGTPQKLNPNWFHEGKEINLGIFEGSNKGTNWSEWAISNFTPGVFMNPNSKPLSTVVMNIAIVAGLGAGIIYYANS